MSKFSIEDLDEVIENSESSLVQMLALQLKAVLKNSPNSVPESIKDKLITVGDMVEDNDEYCQDVWKVCLEYIFK